MDGSSYLYRAFHALPELKSPRGEPTGAIRGVLAMLRRLAEDHKAEARACVFDARGPTFREAEYAEYKAHRPSMPEPLAAQIEPLKEAVAALGWPVLAVEGVEADVRVLVNQCDSDAVADGACGRLANACQRFLSRTVRALPALPRHVAKGDAGRSKIPRVWERPDSPFGHAMLWLGRAVGDAMKDER